MGMPFQLRTSKTEPKGKECAATIILDRTALNCGDGNKPVNKDSVVEEGAHACTGRAQPCRAEGGADGVVVDLAIIGKAVDAGLAYPG